MKIPPNGPGHVLCLDTRVVTCGQRADYRAADPPSGTRDDLR